MTVDTPLRWREVALVGLMFAVASVVLTLPLALHPDHTLPSDYIDTLLTTWTVAWVADHLRHGLHGVWNAPIYFPYQTTLAFSENLFGVALFVAPLYWISGNPLLTYNVAFMVAFALAGTGMYLLVRALSRSRVAAAVAGAYYAFGPFRMAQPQLSHIQMLSTGWLAIALWALHEYFREFARRWLVLFAVACCLQVLSNSYVAYFMAVPIVVVVGAHAITAFAHLRRWSIDLAVTAVLILAALAPVAAQYVRVRNDFHQIRSTAEIESGGADLRAYTVAASGVWRWLLPIPHIDSGGNESELFPGVVAPLLAAVAVFAAATGRRQGSRWTVVYGLVLVAGVVLSFGPVVRAWGVVLTHHGPYDWLQHLVPGMNGMRMPSRFVVIALVGLSVLSGLGAQVLLLRIRPRFQALAAAVLVIGVVADGWNVPIPVVRYSPRGRPEDRAMADWLRDKAAGGVIHLPVMTYQFQELHYQYVTLTHGHPIVNGMTGWRSPLLDLLRQGWSPLYDYARFAATVKMLRAIGVRYAVVHASDYNVTQLANGELTNTLDGLRRSGQAREEKRMLDTYAFELDPWPAANAPQALLPMTADAFQLDVSQQAGRAPFLVDGDPDSRWIGVQDGSSWIAARLSQPTDIARVELDLAERSLMDYPRDLEIDSEDEEGHTRVLYREPPFAEYLTAFLRNPSYPAMAIDLPENHTVVLRVHDLGKQSSYFWSVHELRLWRRP